MRPSVDVRETVLVKIVSAVCSITTIAGNGLGPPFSAKVVDYLSLRLKGCPEITLEVRLFNLNAGAIAFKTSTFNATFVVGRRSCLSTKTRLL